MRSHAYQRGSVARAKVTQTSDSVGRTSRAVDLANKDSKTTVGALPYIDWRRPNIGRAGLICELASSWFCRRQAVQKILNFLIWCR